ncbi:hypothetical protein LJK88_16160 [Paenibacillus sp. P26]|nr:hypothetical protein LJK88_16160 [Paenibacillus sp. P26]
MEEGDVRSIFRKPRHPYTQGLIRSIPHPDQTDEVLYSISGAVPGIGSMPQGRRFHPRCPDAADLCRLKEPEMLETDGDVRVRAGR